MPQSKHKNYYFFLFLKNLPNKRCMLGHKPATVRVGGGGCKHMTAILSVDQILPKWMEIKET